jgi:hypothetical protein
MESFNLNQPSFQQILDLPEDAVVPTLNAFLDTQLKKFNPTVVEYVGLWIRRADHHFIEKALENWFLRNPGKTRLAIIDRFAAGYWKEEPDIYEEQKISLKSLLVSWREQFK